MILGYFYAHYFTSTLNPMVDTFRDRVDRGEIQLTQSSLFFNNVYVAILIYFGGAFFGIATASLLITNGLFIGFFATKYSVYYFLVLTLPHGIFEIPGIIIAGAGGFAMFTFLFNFFKGIIFPKIANFENSDELNSFDNLDELNSFENSDELDSFEKLDNPTNLDSPEESDNLNNSKIFKGSFYKNSNNVISNSFNSNIEKLFQSVVLLVVASALLLIAAFIEANLTLPIAKLILNI